MVQVARASPFESVVALEGLNDCPLPDAGVNVTAAFGTPVPIVVTTRTTICCGSAAPTRPDCPSPLTMVMPLGGGGVALALNATLTAPLGGLIDATSDLAPVVVGMVQRVVASPFASVLAVVGLTLPPLSAGVNVTVSLMTGSLF